jgi:DNA modification methylase
MIDHGWILRAPIVWQRADGLAEPSAKDRPWRTHEFIFMFAKARKYFFDRAKLAGDEDVWAISARPRPNGGLGTAPFPDELVKKCLAIGCRPGGHVIDPFAGSGTTVRVAIEMGYHATGVELNGDFCDFAARELLRM